MPAVAKNESRQNAYDARRSLKRADVSPIPKPADLARREACGKSLRLFLETYFPRAFRLKWSPDHLHVIEQTEAAILGGGISAVAMPRGSGKTTIHQRAAMWAINYGLRPYVFIVAADAKKANQGLRSIKTEYEFNPLLYADFPEICKPIRMLEGTAQAAHKQHNDGVPTLIDWTAERAQLPNIVGSPASGALIGVGGITAASRGAQVTLPNGDVLRPSLVLVDDFQTRESAASLTQSKTRLDTLTGDLLGMRGPGEPFAMLVTCTVIYRGDAADQLLDRKAFPEFHGTRKKLIYSWPASEKRWEEYAELRKQAFREDREPVEAQAYVQEHFDEMHEGSQVAWPERKLDDELSALQHAYNLKIADPDAFSAEYQNDPVDRSDSDLVFATADQIAEKLSNRPPNELPGSIEQITAAIDVQGNSLWWCVAAWGAGFSGYVVDYGCFPQQGRRFYHQKKLPKSFQTEWPGMTEEEAITKALGIVVGDLAGRQWTLDSGAQLGIGAILVDEGYKDSTIHLFCKQSPHRTLLTPCKGWGSDKGRTHINEWPKKQGETVGWGWRKRLAAQNRTMRHILWCANSWKTFLQERWVTPAGGNGCLSLCGNSSLEHRLFAQHQTAEFATKGERWGRTFIEWKVKPAAPDNHWLDALAMCFVGASTLGVKLMESPITSGRKQRMSLEEMQKRAKAG